MNVLGALLAVFHLMAATEAPPPHPVVVVDDPREIRAAVGFRIDGTFTPTESEAEAPRRDLARYLEAERRHEKSDVRQERLRRIEQAMNRYFWHCGGYTKDRQKYLFCSFVRYATGDLSRLGRKTFPVIHDGGVSVCHCHFSRKLGQIIRLEWNGEA